MVRLALHEIEDFNLLLRSQTRAGSLYRVDCPGIAISQRHRTIRLHSFSLNLFRRYILRGIGTERCILRRSLPDLSGVVTVAIKKFIRRQLQRGYLTPAIRWHLPHCTTSRVAMRQYVTWQPMFVVEK